MEVLSPIKNSSLNNIENKSERKKDNEHRESDHEGAQ